jgi:hypothetical protein
MISRWLGALCLRVAPLTAAGNAQGAPDGPYLVAASETVTLEFGASINLTGATSGGRLHDGNGD